MKVFLDNRKARQDFDGLGELFCFYFPNLEVSTSSYCLAL